MPRASTFYMASEEQHREVVVELRNGADPDYVGHWIRRRGLEVLPLAAGLLATGSAKALRAAFGAGPEGELLIPAELRAHVKSVSIVPAKRMH